MAYPTACCPGWMHTARDGCILPPMDAYCLGGWHVPSPSHGPAPKPMGPPMARPSCPPVPPPCVSNRVSKRVSNMVMELNKQGNTH